MNLPLTRRQALLGSLAVGTTALMGCGRTDSPSTPTFSQTAPPPVDLSSYIEALEKRHGARIGVWASDLETGTSAAYRSEEAFAMCSTFKPYAVAAALRLASSGRLDLEQAFPVAAADIVVNSPVLSTMIGSSITLSRACEAALTDSDNTAGNIVLRAIGGPTAVTSFARSIGDDRTTLDRWEPELNEAVPGDLRDTTSPQALATGYTAILVGDALESTQRDRLTSWMRATRTSDKRFRAALPQGWTSADKTGAGNYGSTNDAGLVLGPRDQQILLAVMTRSGDDRQDAAPFNDAIADTVRTVMNAFGHA
ncbi:class A beta-lactamase [Rhodococcus sp. BP-149]|uniref:class A beta-lactamase n=1 Tax=unclassified Rhodococcus (in: high G+C Gram-positive bacteria) TaxID=192944 RepID=UPI001C9A953B|nr:MULTISPECIES: class A beta-lactamase [unclassified Rhodococcus (in: high G+C Gram-positive bacteria)]MBY6693775.1 class A beta-lactamase [Rhodococcus sp. BP-188]MBY6724099.1 class A beta-lactamase [Rhodococcus sp. BP-149]MBY6686135.1 class A beta-lactamase [Rhodococcus sp. BP-288]MBY6699628.1 class A beta-lactamase [Rhodococcus sp. BP-285]MBY6704027.1 class A beta-lactamase [Rhodococcus sp. BP-283]